MTARQRLTIEQSEKRQKINELLAIEPAELTDEQRGDLDTLTKRMQQIEPELRAAIVAEGEEEAAAAGAFSDTADGESAEIRGLLTRVSLSDYLAPAAGGSGIIGAGQGRLPRIKQKRAPQRQRRRLRRSTLRVSNPSA